MEIKGLSKKEVEKRIFLKQVNKNEDTHSKSYKKIIYDNLFTLFNFINITLAFFIALTGSFKNMLFLGVMFWNIVIGIYQEIRAKMTLDKISLIVNRNVCAIRDSKEEFIHPEDVVIDDILKVKSGSQIVSDGILMQGSIEVDESLLTGESDPIVKNVGDLLYSGSFVVAGSAIYKVTSVGKDNYASKMVKDAKRMQKHPSQLRDSLNAIIKYIGIMIIPLGILMYVKHYFVMQETWQESILSTSAALIGMIPEGLVILTSIALAVGVINLARHKTLVQELYCLETLARVDVLCLDKTGTITEGKLVVDQVVGDVNNVVKDILSSLHDENSTSMALYEYFGKSDRDAIQVYPFSSSRKYSGVRFEKETYLMGAYEVLLNDSNKNKVEAWSKEGYRVITIVKTGIDETLFKKEATLIGFVLLVDKIRENAQKTLSYFKSQDVDIRIISGDHPLTVAQVAKKAGLEGYDQYIDASTLINEEDVKEALYKYKIFGRVSPQQKKTMIQILKRDGHCVGMSGDGVNDVLAFKEADISIAMANGSEIAKNSANLVLLDNDFDALPHVLYEGRRVINNIQKVATLFLTKTIFSIILTFLTLLVSFPYPFEPIQLTFMSSLCIGIPAFFLALEPNRRRIQDDFLKNVVGISLPAAISVIVCILYVYIRADALGLSEGFISQLCFIAICMNGYIVLLKCAYPYTPLRIVLVGSIAISMLLGLRFGSSIFSFENIEFMKVWTYLLVFSILLIFVSYILKRTILYLYDKYKR